MIIRSVTLYVINRRVMKVPYKIVGCEVEVDKAG